MHIEYAESIRKELAKNRIRCELNSSSDGMGQKVRGFEVQKVPYIIVVGDKEKEAGEISVRLRDGNKMLGSMKLDRFIKVCNEMNADLRIELASEF